MAASDATVGAPTSEAKDMELEAAVKRFQELRSREQQLLAKITEMAAQESEYRHVSTLTWAWSAANPRHRRSRHLSRRHSSLAD
jgi:Iap family predicted aminopeptidase